MRGKLTLRLTQLTQLTQLTERPQEFNTIAPLNHTSTRNFTASDTQTTDENACHVSISANVTFIDCSNEAVPADGGLPQQIKPREIKIQAENAG